MTPLRKLRVDLIDLSKEQIGMSNYMAILRRYQILLLGIIDASLELEEKMEAALPPPDLTTIESKKDLT